MAGDSYWISEISNSAEYVDLLIAYVHTYGADGQYDSRRLEQYINLNLESILRTTHPHQRKRHSIEFFLYLNRRNVYLFSKADFFFVFFILVI